MAMDKQAGHAPFTGTHTHSHPAFGDQGEDETHEHEHSHDNDADHSHHEEKAAPALEVPPSLPLSDDGRKSLLSIYNSIGQELGLEPVGTPRMIAPETLAGLEAISTGLSLLLDGLADNETLLIKEGRELSEKNITRLKEMHTALTAMVPTICLPEGEQEAQDEASRIASAMVVPLAAIEGLTRALSELGVQELVARAIEEALIPHREMLEALKCEEASITASISALKHMPLGRPTSFVGRSLYQKPLMEEKAETIDPIHGLDIIRVQRPTGPMIYRKWPDGHLLGERPPLSPDEKSFMSPLDIVRYQEGAEVLVPLLDRAAG